MYDPVHSCTKMNGIRIYVGKLPKRPQLSTLSYSPVEIPVEQGNNKMAVTCLPTLNLRIKALQDPKNKILLSIFTRCNRYFCFIL